METIGINQTLLAILNALRNLTDVFNQFKESQPRAITEDTWLHTEDVMEIFGTCRKTIYNWRKNEAIRFKKIGKIVYYLKSDIYKMLNT